MFKIIGGLFLFIYSFIFSGEIRKVKLTQYEKEWVESIKKDEIKIYLDSDLGILNYNTKGVSKGIYPEVIKILEKSTGLHFKVVKESERVFEEEVDSGIPDVVMGIEDYRRNRSQYYYLKEPIKLNGVFITRDDYPITDSKTDLTGKNIAYVRGDQIVNEVIKRYGSKLHLFPKPSPEKAGESLLSGEADIYVEDLEDALKYLVEDQVSGIKINASSPSLKTKYYIGGLHKLKPLIEIIGRIVNIFELNEKSVYNEALDYTKNKLNISNEIRDYLKKIRF